MPQPDPDSEDCARILPGETMPAVLVRAAFGLGLARCIRAALWLSDAVGFASPIRA